MPKFQKITLKALKKKLRSQKISGLALDIDDTLSQTDYHYFATMAKLVNPEKLSWKQIVKKYKWFRSVPQWKTKEAMAIIDGFIGSSDFHFGIPLIKGTDRAVRKIHGIIPVVAYITARPVSTYQGTRKWLEKHRLPNAPILFRSAGAKHEERNSWKAGILKTLYPEVLGIVDDHPKLKPELKAVGYKGRLFLYDSGRNTKRYHHRTSRFRTWADITKEIKKIKKQRAG